MTVYKKVTHVFVSKLSTIHMDLLLIALATFLLKCVVSSSSNQVVAESNSRNGCPQRGLIKPCTCYDKNRGLDISCEGSTIAAMKESLGNLAASGKTVMYLKLTRNPLETLPSFLLEGLNVIHIIANYNNISTIEDDSFRGMEQTLESLDLSQNTMFQVPTSSLKGLSSLISLNIGYNSLEMLPSRAFTGLISLLRLSLFGNKINLIDPLAFKGIGGNLTRINLGGNLLTSVPTSSLRELQSLQTLELQSNRIRSVTRANFLGVQASNTIDTLNLSDNLIETIANNSFVDLHSLNSLDLEGNLIHTINLNAFVNISDTLEWLKLANNQLTEIPSKQLKDLNILRELDFRENNISIIGENSLKPFGRRTKFVYLQKNRIHTIHEKAFDSLTKVEWLYLYSNQLTELPKRTLEPLLGSLTVLDIHDNPFKCNCDILWFRDLTNRTSNLVSLPGETKCSSPDDLSRQPIAHISSIPGCSNNCQTTFTFATFRLLVVLTTITIFLISSPRLQTVH